MDDDDGKKALTALRTPKCDEQKASSTSRTLNYNVEAHKAFSTSKTQFFLFKILVLITFMTKQVANGYFKSM